MCVTNLTRKSLTFKTRKPKFTKLLANIWFICFTQENCKEVRSFWTISSNYGGDDSIYGILGCQQISCGDKWIAVPSSSVRQKSSNCLLGRVKDTDVFVFLCIYTFSKKKTPLPASGMYLCTVIMTRASLTNDDIGLLVPALAFIIIS